MVDRKKLVYVLLVVHSYQSMALSLEHWAENAVYAPWRDTYKKEEKAVKRSVEKPACVFCAIPHDDTYPFILWRGEYCFVTLNIYPYTQGHVLVIPYEHTAKLSDLCPEARLEIMDTVARALDILQAELDCVGFNVGLNLGAAAKASVPDHLHVHVMPRYPVDSGFANLIGGVTVVAWDLPELSTRLKPLFLAK